MKDLYAVLGVARNATEKQIRAKFLELARSRHPDRFHGEEKEKAEEEFQAMTEALNVLIDPERRRTHDLSLARPAGAPQNDAGNVGKVYLQRGIRAYRSENYLEAAENFDRATKEDPEDANAWYHLALACRHQRRWLRRATAAITRATELEPMNTTYLKLAGKLFEMAAMPVRAERYYRQALEWGGTDELVEDALKNLAKGKR